MPETEQQDETLSELVVKEAITRGMDSPMRDSILEAVDEADGRRSGGRLPLAGALFGLGAAVGFLAGRSSELEESPIEDLEEPEIIEDVMETTEESDDSATETTTEDEETEGGSSVVPRLLLALGVLAGAAVLRRRLSGGEEEEWEPIEEFEPATSEEMDEGEEPETAEGEEAEESETEEEE